MSSVPKINLLPWRELNRIHSNEKFRRYFIVSVVLAIIIAGMAYAYQWHRLDHQQRINDEIKARMTALDDDIAKIANLEREQQEILEKVALIDDLGQNRVAMVRLFEQLALSSRDLVYLSAITHTQGTLTITGQAKNSANVSRFVQKISVHELAMMDDAMVTGLQNSTDGTWVEFVISAKLRLTDTDDIVSQTIESGGVP